MMFAGSFNDCLFILTDHQRRSMTKKGLWDFLAVER
jgi:hypothetical protein